jgi:hypothetical protein
VTYYVPGTEEKDPKKIIMSLQQVHETTATNTADIATNTTDIAANTAAIATKTQLGALQGLITANNAATPNTKIDIGVGAARDTTNAFDLTLSSGLTKDLNAAWAVGNAGGLDTGSIAANQTYHLFLIRKTSDGSTDALFSLSPTAPTMPSGYAGLRRIAAITTNGSSIIRPYKQTAGWFFYKTAVQGFGFATTPAIVATVLTGLPLGIKVQAELLVASVGAAAGYVLCRDPDLGVPSAVDATTGVHYRISSATDAGRYLVWTNASAQVYLGDSAASPQMFVNVMGWYDLRDGQ